MATNSIVYEDVQHLNRLLDQFRATPQERKLQMLLLLKSDPTTPYNQIAEQLQCSLRTVQRWQRTYQTQGLDTLLQNRQRTNEHHISEQELDALREILSEGEMETLEDIQRWLREQFNRHISKRGISGILSRINARHLWVIRKTNTPDNHHQEVANKVQNQIIRFLAQLPVEIPVGEWCRETRDMLQETFPDIDRVTISVNTHCDLLHPKEYKPTFAISQDAYPAHQHKGLHITRHSVEGEANIAETLLNEFQRQGYPIERYHPPCIMQLTYRGAYLGTIFFWRDRSESEVSQTTLQTLAHLEEFLVYALSDAVMRHHYTTPVERVFYSTLREVATQAKLTSQEYRVIAYRLLGYMYKEIALELNVSQDSVKKTLQQVYRKTETGSHIEFFAKCFTPRVVPPRPAEEQG